MRTLAINLAVLAGLAAVLLFAAEIWLRLTVPENSGGTIYEYTLASKRYKVMKPNAAIVAWGKELRTNELGFRDERSAIPAKQPGEYRIVVLGDSMTVSAGVDFEDIYTSRLEALLRRAHSGVRVINLAVGGYNLLQYALVLEEVGLALQPDLILIGLVADNDFALDTYEDNYRVASGQEPPPQAGWGESVYVYRAFLGKAVARVLRTFEKPQPKTENQAFERNEAALRAILANAKRRGVPVAAVVLPQNWDYDKQRPAFAKVAAVCRAHGLPCLDLLERFSAHRMDPRALRLNALDTHPNENYNAAVAEALREFLRPMVPSAPPAFDRVRHSAR